MPITRSHGNVNKTAATKRTVSDVLPNTEDNEQTMKRAKKSTHQQQCSASPVTPPIGPRKCTNEHPGHLIGKQGRHTKGEIAIEKAKKEAKVKATAATKADAVAQLVEMEVDQELEEAARCQCVLRHQPSVLDVLANNSGEDFNWSEAEDDKEIHSNSEEELAPTSHGCVAGSKQVKGHKPKDKRALLAQVAEQKEVVRGKKGGAKKGVTAFLPLTSGLKEGLKEKAKLNHSLIQDDSMVGGLNDEDALSVRPQFEKRKQGSVNVVIASISDSNDSGNESTPVCGSNAKTARGPTQTNKAVYKVPAERKPVAKMGKLKAAIVPKASNRINTVKSEVVEIPSALNHLLKIVHKVFKKMFPDVQYKPVHKDVFHHTIYDNLQTIRSNLARTTLGNVITFLSEMSKQEVKEWVVWTRAARLGELVYKDPCPPGCSLVKGAPNFKKPKGLLMTPFVINLTAPYLKYMHSSLIDYGHPRGLIALILVSLEHGVQAFKKNREYEDPGPFNSGHKALLTEYIESVDTFNKWQEFYQACKFTKANSESEAVLTVDVSQTDIGRHALNFSSSPIKG
ncbi:hypothetical protein F5148DRAFT_1147149 [Russula earlei]|uniref:Uncharacterized protein n=1 Tax=Russula earlei TaxID=71964 RepID=A0ACC0UH06_9AGAM|nr:hypothetical protein F5148DRAFT_1147149 [Russula earlei]